MHGRVVVLERAEVEHLLAVAEVHGELVALPTLTCEERFTAQARVVAAECDRRRLDGRVSSELGALEAEMPRLRAVLLHRQEAQARVVVDEELGDGIDEMVGAVRAEPFEHGRLGVLTEAHEGVRERRAPVAFAPVQHEDRILDDDPGRHVYEGAAGEERIVQRRERVRSRSRHAAERIAQHLVVARRDAADPYAFGLEGGVALVTHDAPVAYYKHCRVLSRFRGPRAPARCALVAGRSELVGRQRPIACDVELVDARIAPDLLGGRRPRDRAELLRRREAPLEEPLRPPKRPRRVGRERLHLVALAARRDTRRAAARRSATHGVPSEHHTRSFAISRRRLPCSARSGATARLRTPSATSW